MKKTVKRLLSTVMAAVLALGGLVLSPITAKAANDYTAFLMFTDNDWAFGNWDSALANTTVSSEGGSYSVTLNATDVGGDGTVAANGAQVFCVDIEGANAGLSEEGKTFAVTDLSIVADGNEVAVDVSKLITGDIEDNGNFRIEIYNAFGAGTADDSPIGDASAFTFADTLTVNFTVEVVDAPEGDTEGLISSTESYEAFIAIGADRDSEGDWGLEYYGDASIEHAAGITATNGTVKAGETTTISLEFENPVSKVWFVAPCLIFPNGDAAQISAQSDFDIKVYLDDEEVDVDFSAGAICWSEGTGDYLPENLVRLAGGYNEWGSQYIASPSGFSKISFEITANAILLAPVEEAPQYEFDPNGTYHAYLGVQTPTWIFRNAYDDASYGRDVDGGAYFGELGFIDDGWQPQGGTFTDVEITGNGTYTVSLTGYDFSGDFNGESIMGTDGTFNLLFLSTDLPRNDAVVISNIVLKMDGKEITTKAEAFLDPDKKETQSVLLANIWNNEISALPYYAAPTNSIEISFTVSGFAKDAEIQAPAATEEPSGDTSAPAESPAATEEPAEGGSNTTMIIIIVVVVVVVAAVVCGVVVSKKKKK